MERIHGNDLKRMKQNSQKKETNKTALEKDPYSIAWKNKNKSKITFDTVGKKFEGRYSSSSQEAGKWLAKYLTRNVILPQFQKEDLKNESTWSV